MSFPTSDIVQRATRYHQTVAVATAIKNHRPDLADRVWVPDNGPIAVLIDVGGDRKVVVAQVAGPAGPMWTIASPYLNDEPPPIWPLRTDRQILAEAATTQVDAALQRAA